MAKKSTVLQMLLDLAHEGGKDVRDMTLDELIEHLENDDQGKNLAKATDKRFNMHRYPTDSITFTKLSTLDQVPTTIELSDKTAKLLLLLCQSMGQTCCVRGTVRSLADAWGMERSSLQRAFKELEDFGYIAHIKYGSGRGTVSVYMVNPKIAKQGIENKELQKTFDDLCSPKKQKLTLANFETIDIGRETVVTSKLTGSSFETLKTKQDKLYASTVKRTKIQEKG